MTQSDIQDQINSIVRELIDVYKPEKVVLFGSYACAETTNNSDSNLWIKSGN